MSITSKDSKYEFKLEIINSKLCIKATKKKELLSYLYEDSMENLGKLSAYFQLLKSIEEIKEEIYDLLTEGNYDLVEENSILKIILKPNKRIIIELILKKIEDNINTKFDIIIKRLNDLESEYKTFQIKHKEFEESTKREIDSLKKENGDLKKKLKECEEPINLLKNKITELKDIEDLFQEELKEKKRDKELDKELKQYLIGDGEEISNIKRYKDYALIVKGIKSQIAYLNNETIKLKLIYKSSKHGYTAKDFHTKCDNKGPTVTVIRTKDNITFGGFTSINWSDKNEEFMDEKSFLFSFDKNKIYKNKKTQGLNNITCRSNYGPHFDDGIMIRQDFKQENQHYVSSLSISQNRWNGFSYEYELNDGNQYFCIDEIEVFRISG